MAYFYAHAQCVLLFLVLAEIPLVVEFHIVTRSYSSHLFLCALADAMVLFVSKPITFDEVDQLLYEVTVLWRLVSTL